MVLLVGFDKQPKVVFDFSDDALPTAITCDIILRLPTVHMTRDHFVESFCLALKGNIGFGHIIIW